jgi:acetyl-CoA carboxylase biotin carboxyl carrier protein
MGAVTVPVEWSFARNLPGVYSMATRKTGEARSTEGLSRSDIVSLIDVIHEKGIEEFELEQGSTRLRIVSSRQQVVTYAAPAPVAQPAAPAPAAPTREIPATSSTPGAQTEEDDSRLRKITSPMVGTFYRSSAPGAKPYCEVGDKVDENSVLCIIEAMKLMNEIKAECRGHVKRILVENAQPVEYGQVLFLIEPS